MIESMVAYSYNKLNGELLGEVGCQPNPLAKGQFLVPGSATTVKPLKAMEKEAAVFEKETKQWKIVPDYRKDEFWSKETGGKVKLELGQVPDEKLTELDPSSFENAKWDEVKASWEAGPVEEVEEDDKLKEIEQRIAALENKLGL